jgi:hypothetical protein
VGAQKSRTNEARKRIVIVSLFFLGIDGVIGGGQIGQGLAMLMSPVGWGRHDCRVAPEMADRHGEIWATEINRV